MNILGYSYQLNEKNDETLASLNLSVEELMKSNEVLKKFESIDFHLEGAVEDSNLRLMFRYKTKDGKEGNELFSSHVDKGAISLTSEWIQAYFGEKKFENISKDLEENFNILEADYLEKQEPELYQQLSEEYLLSCSPNVRDGAEFTKEDERLFLDILEQVSPEPYDAVIELNEYIEKFSEILPHLEQVCENINNGRVLVKNDGCDEYLVRKVVGYLENHGIIVQFN